MNHALQVELLEKALALVSQKTTDMVEAESRQPVEAYVSRARFEQEQRMLRDEPVIVADASDLRDVGDYVTAEVGGAPIIVLRGDDGKLRGFLNACRHRRTRLARARSGKGCKALVCPYHAWSYRTDGSLLHIPDGFGFPSASERDLDPIRIAERHGFVWAVVNGSSDADIDAHVESLGELAGFSLGTHTSVHPYDRDVAANWKIVIEQNLEAYHVKSTHAGSIYKRIFFGNKSIVDRLGDKHLRIVFPRVNITDIGDEPKDAWSIRRYAYIGYFIFPNTVVLIEPDHATRLTVHPTGAETAQVRIRTLVPEAPRTEAEWAAAKRDKDLLEITLDEDFDMSEEVAIGLRADPSSHMLIGRFEQGIQYFHLALRAALRAT